jgi:mycothiol synthase
MDFDIVRANPISDSDVLDLASRTWPAAERSSYAHAIDSLIESGQEDFVLLFAACRSGQVLAAQIGQVLPGRVAVVWPPGIATTNFDRDALAKLLFERVITHAAAAGATLAQGLSSPDDADANALFACGDFSPAAELLYLAAPPADEQNEVELPFELLPAHNEARLKALIDRTYIGTLDCPSLDGLRDTADVIAGYRAVGEHRPDFWLIAQHAGQDVGCLLLNLHPDVNHAEIIYLAVVPEARGRGWGLRLAKVAKTMARAIGAAQVVLAVDATNRPAIRLYEDAGFFSFDRRTVWIKSLREKSQVFAMK